MRRIGRSEIGPGMFPHVPIEGTHFVDLSRVALRRWPIAVGTVLLRRRRCRMPMRALTWCVCLKC